MIELPTLPLPAAPRRASPRTIPEQIADELGTAIVAGKHATGERLLEQELADSFGVSRGPIREALRVLERRGLVHLMPRRGAYVKSVSLNAVADLFNVRLALAGYAARLMAARPVASYIETLQRRLAELDAMAADENADPLAFALSTTRAVRTIAKGSGNEQLAELMAHLADQSVWTLVWRHPLDYVTLKRRRSQARNMRLAAEAIEAGQPDLAEQRLRHALEESRDVALATLRKLRGEHIDPHKLARSS